MMKYILLTVFFQAAFAKCPNGCSGHGDCNLNDQCDCFNEKGDGELYLVSDKLGPGTCFKAVCKAPADGGCEAGCKAASTVGPYICIYDTTDKECKYNAKNTIIPDGEVRNQEWRGADCSRRTCPRATSWSTYGAKHIEEESEQSYRCSHKSDVECADQGLCDRATGLCECFPGFTGNACQRTACPDDCSGHGTCRSNKDFAYDFAVAKTHQLLQTDLSTEMFHQNYVVTYDDAWDSTHLYGCLCDRGYRGANCALIECPSSNDPLDDKCSKESDEPAEDFATVENFQVQKFAATGSVGWMEAYTHSKSNEQGDPCNPDPNVNIADVTGEALCKAVTGFSGEKCTWTPKVAANPGANPPVLASPNKCEMVTPFKQVGPGDKNNHFYNGKVYACFGAMAGMDCSGRGICDYSTGQCSCFSGYSGTSCNEIEELV